MFAEEEKEKWEERQVKVFKKHMTQFRIGDMMSPESPNSPLTGITAKPISDMFSAASRSSAASPNVGLAPISTIGPMQTDPGRQVSMHLQQSKGVQHKLKKWIDEMSRVNKRIPKHHHYDCETLELTSSSQLRYFEKFMKVQSASNVIEHCSFSTTTHYGCHEQAVLTDPDGASQQQKDLIQEESTKYYSQFLDSWTRTPDWYTVCA